MRALSAAQLKGRRDVSAANLPPNPESAAGALYALLRANAGHVVSNVEIEKTVLPYTRGGSAPDAIGSAVTKLRNFYCCDIRARRGTHGWHMLAGEYFGRDYVDYCAAEFEKGLH